MSVRRSARLSKQYDTEEGSPSSVQKTPKMTPLSKELRKVINQNSILSMKTKSKFLTDLDRHIQDNNNQWKDKMRSKIIEEIISSEESYLKQLEILIKFFMEPLKKVDFISPTECNTLFYNIQSLERISRELLNQLTNDDNVGTAFITMTPYFKVYSLYAYNYNSVLQILQTISTSNKKLCAFIAKQESRPEVANKITALLITPIQRIPRYRLLLKEVLNYTALEHPHYSSIQKALQEVTSTTDHINQLVLDQQHMTRLVEVQRNLAGGKPTIVVPGRQLIREGTLMKMRMKGSNKVTACYMILLSDIIMYCKEWRVHEKLRCLRVLPLSKCTVTKLMFKQGLFNLTCNSISYILYSVTTSEEGNAWYNAIKKAIADHKEKFQTLRKRYSSKKVIQRKDLHKISETVSLKEKRKRKASNTDISSECGLHSPWKVLKLSQSIIPSGLSKSNVHGNQPSRHSKSSLKEKKHEETPKCGDVSCDGSDKYPHVGFSNSDQTVSNTSGKNEDKSFTRTIMVQAKTVVNMLGESMRRYLLPGNYAPK